MGFTAITQAEIAAGQPVTQALMQKVKDNDDYLYSQVGAGGGGGEGGIPNGSFEIDADADGVPDGWTKNLYPAGGGAIETTNPMHGAAAYKFVQQAGPGNGGGYLDQNDYLPCSPQIPLTFDWLHYASAAGMHNIVQVRWFDKGKVYVSSTDIYNSTSNPTSAAKVIGIALPPATAKFYKLRIIGGYTDTDIAGTAYFDGFSVSSLSSPVLLTDKTIAEQTATAEGGWFDHGSFVLNLGPLSGNSLVILNFTAETKYDVAQYAPGQRFRVGTTYSNEETGAPTVYTLCYYTMTLKGVSGALTVYQQLQSESPPGGYTYGRKLDGLVSVQIVLP